MTIIKSYFIFAITLFLSLQVSAQTEKIPVTAKKINDDSTTFRFAIVSDRNGGMRKGVFEDAVKKLNLLQPEFVLSVGDLIDGYTEDPKRWNAEWDEFDGLVNRLDMPFYYVPGNHDTSNKRLTEAWNKRNGRDYYSFIHKNVLFIALNTDEIVNGGISEKQAAYVKNALDKNKDVRWTMIFMHRPLWSYGDQAGYKAIGDALKGRKYTLFSAHHHNYQYQQVDGMDHYVLGTTGGGTWGRGAEVGEFDQITWVTMKNEGPKVAHLNLEGIYDKDLVPAEDYADIQILRKGDWLTVQPSVQNTSTFKSIPVSLIIKNDMKRPMDVSGTLSKQYGIHFEPNIIAEQVAPGTEKTIIVNAVADNGIINIQALNNQAVLLSLEAGFKREERKNINLSTSKPMFVDWKHTLSTVKTPVIVDGVLKDWDESKFISVLNPQFFYEDWDWKNADDGKFAFNVTKDAKNLYIAVKFTDDVFVGDKKTIEERQDKFYVHLSPSILDVKNFYNLEFASTLNPTKPLMNQQAKQLAGLKSAIARVGKDQILELSIPLKSINTLNTDAIRVNIGIMDHDHPENTKPSVIWWRPVWDSDASYSQSGSFYIQK